MDMSFLVNALFFDLKWASSLPTFFVPWYGNEFESGRFYPAAKRPDHLNLINLEFDSISHCTTLHFYHQVDICFGFLHEIADSPFIGLQLVRRQEIK